MGRVTLSGPIAFYPTSLTVYLIVLELPFSARYSDTINPTLKGNRMKLCANMDAVVIATIALVMLSNLIHIIVKYNHHADFIYLAFFVYFLLATGADRDRTLPTDMGSYIAVSVARYCGGRRL